MKKSLFMQYKKIWLLCLILLCGAVSIAILAEVTDNQFSVSFENYNGEEVQTVADVPLGAQLYSTTELQEELGDDFTPEADSSFYLYYEGNDDIEAFGPVSIKNPFRSDKYDFKDWKKTDADKTLVIKRDTTFIARYTPKARYVISTSFISAGEDKKTLSETISSMYNEDDNFSIEVPEINGMTILMDEELKELLQLSEVEGVYGNIEGILDQNTLEHLSKYTTTDANGNHIISLWLRYDFPDNTPYTVEYYQQSEDGKEYKLKEKETFYTDTQNVNLQELGHVKEYPHFTIADTSAYNALNCDISPNGDTIIRLDYDRDKYELHYDTTGGVYLEPEIYYYGQNIVYTEEAENPGYKFLGWDYKYIEDDLEHTERPETMPAGDVYLTAKWEKTEANYRIVYWVRNPNMTVEGQDDVYIDEGAYTQAKLPTGTNLYEEFRDGKLDDIIKDNFISDTSDYVNGRPDVRYFEIDKDYTLSHNNQQLIVDGTGQTTLAVYFKRKSYKLGFVLAKVDGTTYKGASKFGSGTLDSVNWKETANQKPQILDDAGNDLTEIVTISGTQYVVYNITAKFNEDILDKWPVNENIKTTFSNKFTGWNTSINAQGKNIYGKFGEVSSDIISNPADTEQVKYLIAVYLPSTKDSRFHIMLENIDNTDKTGTLYETKYYTEIMNYQGTIKAGNNNEIFGLEMQGYEYKGFQGKAPDIYYYYTRKQCKLIFQNINTPYYLTQYTNEQKAEFAKHGVIIADDGSVTVKYGADATILKEESAKWSTDSGNMLKYPLLTPGTKKNWAFVGWYKNAICTKPVTEEFWNAQVIENITMYAKWEPPEYSLTYIIPNGYMRSEIIDKLSTEYNCTVTNEDDRQIVKIEGISEGTSAKKIADLANDGQDVAINKFGYALKHWMRQAGSDKEVEFGFLEAYRIYDDLTVVAEWKREPVGQYTVYYLTKDEITGEGYGDMTVDGTTYHRLLPEKVVQGLYYGQTVSENSEEVSGYLAQEYKKTIELTEDTDVYFIYDKITADITYYVHYVLDTGIDYGTTMPVGNAVELIPSKKVVIDGASVKTSITETAEVISGYTPRDQWTGKLSLSVNEDRNHLYFYYNSNNPLQEYKINYIFMNAEGNYDNAFRYECSGKGGIGQVLYGKSYAKDYAGLLKDEEAVKILDEYMKGHAFDENVSDEYVFIDGETVPVLYVYMKNGTYTLTFDLNDSESDNKAKWEAPVEFTDLGDGRYSRSIVYPDYISEPINKPVRKAYVFAGWSYYKEATKPDESIDIFKESGLYQDTVLYAVWKASDLIYIDSLLGTENNEFAVVKAQAPLTAEKLLRSTPHDGWLFKGWYLDKECTIPYNPDNPPEDFLTDEKNYLYAGWRPIGTVATDSADEVLEMCDGSSYTEINNQLPEFEMVGARIRTYEAAGIAQGEWFISRISEQLVNDVESLNPMNIPLQPKTVKDKGKGYGTVVTLAQRIAQDSEFLKDERAVSVSTGNFVSPATLTLRKCNGYKYYSCAVQGMPESYYKAPLLCRAYITYYDCNGNLYTYYYTETGEAYTTERMSGSYAGGYAISYWYTAKYMLDEGFYPEDSEDYEFLQYVYNVSDE